MMNVALAMVGVLGRILLNDMEILLLLKASTSGMAVSWEAGDGGRGDRGNGDTGSGLR